MTTPKIPPESETGNYLRTRGLSWEPFEALGAQITSHLDAESDDRFRVEILGWKREEADFGFHDKGLSVADRQRSIKDSRYKSRQHAKLNGVREILSIPILDAEGNKSWVSRFIPDPGGRKFSAKVGARGPIFIAPGAVQARKDQEQALYITEGPVKAMAIEAAGGLAIGLNGCWGAGFKEEKNSKSSLHPQLELFRWRKRKVYLAFDRDDYHNGDVRRGFLRTGILLLAKGAEVYVLEWKRYSEGEDLKGIDDWLAFAGGLDGSLKARALTALTQSAKPFAETFEPGPGADAGILAAEFASLDVPVVELKQIALKAKGRLKISMGELLPKAKEAEDEAQSQEETLFRTLKPWDTPVDPKELLAALTGLILKHVYISPQKALVVALWILWTYLVHEDFIEYAPFLGITGADKRVGKSRLLKIVEKLTRKSYSVGRLSEAALYRLIEQYKPTLLIDEFHRLLSKYPNLLDLFLLSYERDKKVTLANAETHQLDVFDCWSAKAVAYLGILDEQLRDRIIEIYLKRKPPGEKRARLRETSAEEWGALARKCLRWALDNREEVAAVKVAPLEVSNDRAGDNWEVLLMIAQVIDPEVEVRARAIALEEESNERDEDSVRVQVMKVLRKVFKAKCREQGLNFDDPKTDLAITLKELCSAINREEVGPWKELGKDVTSQWLVKVMRGYRIKAVRIKLTEESFLQSKRVWGKAYRLKDLREDLANP
jgi:hypothetical protein